jgi:hypothetical protein
MRILISRPEEKKGGEGSTLMATVERLPTPSPVQTEVSTRTRHCTAARTN